MDEDLVEVRNERTVIKKRRVVVLTIVMAFGRPSLSVWSFGCSLDVMVFHIFFLEGYSFFGRLQRDIKVKGF